MPRKKSSVPLKDQSVDDILDEASELVREAETNPEVLDESETKPEEPSEGEAPAETKEKETAPEVEQTGEKPDDSPRLNPDELAEKITAQVVDKLSSDKQTVEEASSTESLTNQALKEFFDKHGRNPETYGEQAEVMDKVVDMRLEQKEAEREAKAEADRQAQAEAEAKAKEEEKAQADREYETYSKYWDSQTDELAEMGVLDKDDSGNLTADSKRVLDALYTKMEQLKDEREKSGKMPIYSLIEIYDHHFEDPRQQPPGANAPVAGTGTRTGTSGDSQKMPYGQFHRAGYDDLIQ